MAIPFFSRVFKGSKPKKYVPPTGRLVRCKKCGNANTQLVKDKVGNYWCPDCLGQISGRR